MGVPLNGALTRLFLIRIDVVITGHFVRHVSINMRDLPLKRQLSLTIGVTGDRRRNDQGHRYRHR